MNKIKKAIIAGLALSPMMAMAISTVDDVLTRLNALIGLVAPFLFTFAALYFLWGALQYVINSGDEKARGEGQKRMMYGLIGIVIMISMWGLVAVINSVFGISSSTTVAKPCLGPDSPPGKNCTVGGTYTN